MKVMYNFAFMKVFAVFKGVPKPYYVRFGEPLLREPPNLTTCGSGNPYYENPTILAKLCFLEVLAGVKRALFQKRAFCQGFGDEVPDVIVLL